MDNLVLNAGYKPNYRKNKINDKFKEILEELALDGWFEDYPELNSYSHNEYMEITLNLDKFDILQNFGIVFLDEIDAILNFKTKLKDKYKNRSISPSKILLILAFIRIHKSRRSEMQNYHASKNPEMYYRRFIDIAGDLNISADSVSLAVKILCDLDIIVYKELPRIKYKNGEWRSRVNIFVDKYMGWEDELAWGEKKLTKKSEVNI